MQIRAVQRILGLLLMLFSVTMLPPAAVAWWYGETALQAFLLAFVAVLGLGFLAWAPVARVRADLRVRDGFLVAALFWVVLGLSGAIPLMLAERPHMPLVDAVFESVSGITTTGATVLTGLDDLPRSVLWYRQQLQWLGGMGIIVLAVAIFPMLGVGGMQLYRAEMPGPMKEQKLTPRIAETAKALWYIYLVLTAACALAYLLVGMSPFDAVGHAFSTVAIGGFSTHDASIGYFASPAVEAVAALFMMLAGINFTLHFLAWRRMSLAVYWADSELRAYLAVLLGAGAVTVAYLVGYGTPFWPALHNGLFQVISFATTTGFTTTSYELWPGFLPVLLIFVSFFGACAGSTGGGMKTIRFLLLLKQGVREIRRLVHPNGQFVIKVNERTLPERVIESVWGFFSVYVAVFVIVMLLLMATGLDHLTAFSAVAACLNNLGPGLGEVAANYGGLSDAAKWLLCLAMLMGRLEIFTLLVLFTPAFWRR